MAKLSEVPGKSNTGRELWPHQERGVSAVFDAWREVRRVCLVLPTGGGKTQIGEEVVARYLGQNETHRVIWLAHRRELIKQAADRLRDRFGFLDVGMVMPGVAPEPHASVQVASLGTLIAREQVPAASLVIFDECHHSNAKTYAEFLARYPEALQLGLTATPQRGDGKPLGDMFDRMAVAAQYSELLAGGFLVPMRVYQPPDIPGDGYALDPLTAWERYAPDTQTFAFFGTVEEAKEWAGKFNAANIPAAYVHAGTKHGERAESLAAFKAKRLRVLCNVNVFTEGTDVPAAETILLARTCGHVSIYLQIAGRGVRKADGKTQAKLIDLTGASLIHGLPLEDRLYSLEGAGIKRTSETPLKQCLKCGATILSAYRVCPSCQYVFPVDPRRDPKIYDWALTEVFAGEATPDDAKRREYLRLRRLAKFKGYGLGWIGREYKKLFGVMPDWHDVTEEEKRAEFHRLKAIGAQKGYKPGFAAVVYRQSFGAYPSRGWA